MQVHRATTVLLAFGALTGAACSVVQPSDVAFGPAQSPSRPVGEFCQTGLAVDASILYLFPFTELADWFRYADQVGQFTVVAARPGPRVPGAIAGEPEQAHRDALLEVDDIIAGQLSPGEQVWIRTHDRAVLGAGGDFAADDQCFLLEPGITIVGALLGDGSTADATSLMTAESAVIINGHDVLDTGRQSRPVEELEGLSTEALRAALAASRDQVSQEPTVNQAPSDAAPSERLTTALGSDPGNGPVESPTS